MVLPEGNKLIYWIVAIVVALIIIIIVISFVANVPVSGGSTGADCSITAPFDLSVITGNGQITVVWHNVPSAEKYTVYYHTQPDVSKTVFTNFDENVTSPHIVSGLNNGTTYYFIVTATTTCPNGSVVESGESVTVSGIPVCTADIPVGVVIDSVSQSADNQLTVNWTAIPNAASYDVLRKEGGGVTLADFDEIQQDITGTSATFVNLEPVLHGFIIHPKNQCGSFGTESPEVTNIPTCTIIGPMTLDPPVSNPPEAVIHYPLTSGGTGPATEYRIYARSVPGASKGVFDVMVSITNGTGIFTTTSLTGSDPEYAVMTSIDGCGESLDSNEITLIYS